MFPKKIKKLGRGVGGWCLTNPIFFSDFLLVRLFVFVCLFVYSWLMAGSYECCLLTLHRDDLMSW